MLIVILEALDVICWCKRQSFQIVKRICSEKNVDNSADKVSDSPADFSEKSFTIQLFSE